MELIKEATEAGARRCKACEILGISLRTFQRWESMRGGGDRRKGPRNGPVNALSEAERALVVAVATSKLFCDLSPAQIVPILADASVYLASESTFYRILREERLLSHRGKAQAPRHHRPVELVATGPNEVWSWDITYLKSPVRGSYYYLYLVMDIWSRKIVGWAIHESEEADQAASLIREAAFREGIDPGKLVLHSDNGGPMKGATMLATLQWLGIVPSFSRPHVSDDNPYSESLFHTVKYWPEYPSGPFQSIETAREWMKRFVGWYNDEHRHSAIRFVTPSQKHDGEDRAILNLRKEVYEKAKKENPSRWSGEVRNWKPIEKVALNPTKAQTGRSAEERATAQEWSSDTRQLP